VARGGPAGPVLIVLPSPTRERHLHQRLAAITASRLAIATTSDPNSAGDPAAATWHVAGRSHDARRLGLL
jgi:hypothetical protein